MGRPKTINGAVAEFAAETLRRLRQKQRDDPAWIPVEGQVRIIKLLAEAQVTLQRRKPEEGDEEGDESTPGMSIEELEQMSSDKPSAPPDPESDDA